MSRKYIMKKAKPQRILCHIYRLWEGFRYERFRYQLLLFFFSHFSSSLSEGTKFAKETQIWMNPLAHILFVWLNEMIIMLFKWHTLIIIPNVSLMAKLFPFFLFSLSFQFYASIAKSGKIIANIMKPEKKTHTQQLTKETSLTATVWKGGKNP